MAITAIVLLRGSVSVEGLQTVVLDDATLVKTSIRFDLEPADLAAALRSRLGAALDDQTDARGVFVLPSVALGAASNAKTYDAALDAVGEGGSWVRVPTAGALASDTMEDRALGMDDILAQALSGRPVDPAMLASLLGGLPDDDDDDDDGTSTVVDGEDDDEAGDMPLDLGALMSSPLIQQMMQQMAGALAQSPDAQRDLESAAKDGTLDMDTLAKSPAIAKLIESFGQALGNDPAALGALLGAAPGGDDEE